MPKFVKKPVVIEAITFENLVQFGRENGANIVNGMPWSFSYNGHSITHENDECYLIPTLEGTMKFQPGDMLITGVKGEIYPCKPEIFAATYRSVETRAELELHDHATGVEGTYCIGRTALIHGLRTSEFWNPSGWAGSGYVFNDKRLAEAVLNLLRQATE